MLDAFGTERQIWNRETELELLPIGLREKWIFTAKRNGAFTGTNDDVMEFIDRKRYDEFYIHNCSSHFQEKSKVVEMLCFPNNTFNPLSGNAPRCALSTLLFYFV